MPAFPPACNCPAPISAVQSKNYAVPPEAHLLPEVGTYLPSPNYQIQEAQYYSLPSSSSLIGDRLTGNAPYDDSLNTAGAFRSGYGSYDPNAAFTPYKSSQRPTLAGRSERQGRTKPPFVNPSILVERDKSACHIIGDGSFPPQLASLSTFVPANLSSITTFSLSTLWNH
uniref:Uncharacterized protein n=1 Tax=Ascaris lumbricoides TaxID=6252 RepID=A0A0M3I9I5_ASCLU